MDANNPLPLPVSALWKMWKKAEHANGQYLRSCKKNAAVTLTGFEQI